jgi:hypothetical protein
MRLPSPTSFMRFLTAVFNGYARGDGNFLISAGQALMRLGQRLQRTQAPGKDGFTAKVTAKPQPPAPPPRTRPLGTGQGDQPQYTDGLDVGVKSSWILGLNFRPIGGVGEIVQAPMKGGRLSNSGAQRAYLFSKGDMTMVLKEPSQENGSGRYTYPRVPRKVMNDMLMAPSKGRFYWWGYNGSKGLRTYSNRAEIGQRMKRQGSRLVANPKSRHKRVARDRSMKQRRTH